MTASQWKDLLTSLWAVGLCVAIGYLHLLTYRAPDRNRLTKWLYRYWDRQTQRSTLGIRLFTEPSSALLAQALLLLGLGAVLAVLFLSQALSTPH